MSDTGRFVRPIEASDTPEFVGLNEVSDTPEFVRRNEVSDTLVRFASYQVRLPRVSDTGSGRRLWEVQNRPTFIVI